MTKLLVHELGTSLFQQITVGSNRLDVEAIRPHLYLHASPSGSLQVQIQDTNGKIVAQSNTRTITSMKTLAYAHKFFLFSIKASLKPNETYRIALVASGGYSFSESAYVGWCNGFDSRTHLASYGVPFGTRAPLDFELWTKRLIRRGGSR